MAITDDTLGNFFYDVEKQYGDITGSYTALVDLGEDYIFRGLLITSSLDKDVVIKFPNAPEGDPEMNIPYVPNVGFQISLDNFRHNGALEIKAAGDVPTSGFLKLVSWRAE